MKVVLDVLDDDVSLSLQRLGEVLPWLFHRSGPLSGVGVLERKSSALPDRIDFGTNLGLEDTVRAIGTLAKVVTAAGSGGSRRGGSPLQGDAIPKPIGNCNM
jgi:hypothetical protein